MSKELGDMTLEELQKENNVLKNFVKESDEKVAAAELKVAEVVAKLEAYEAIGEAADIQASIDSAIERITATTAELETARESLVAYETIGTVSEVNDAADLLAKYSEFATVKELGDVEALLEGYTTLGTVEALTESLATLESYKSTGTVEEFTAMKEESVKLESAKEEARKEAIVESISTSHGISKELALETLELKGWDEAVTVEFISKFVTAKAPNVTVDPLVGKTLTPAKESAPLSQAGRILKNI